MITQGAEGVAHVAALMRQKILPKIADSYVATDVQMTAMLLDLISEDFDRSVDVMLRDERHMQELLRLSLPWLDSPLSAGVQACLERAGPEDFRVRTLSNRADRDMTVFIAVHACIEQASELERNGARKLEHLLWQFIEDYVERRRYVANI